MAPRIAIFGAGPAGLTLASLLTKASIPYRVYELRPKPDPSFVNKPSGSLDLHTESGLLAIEACGLTEAFKPLTADCGEDMIIADKAGVVRLHAGGDDGSRPEIARNSLTNLLLSTVPGENISWNHKVKEVLPLSGKWVLKFQDQTSEEYDFVVGSDGAWSHVRQQLTSVRPHFSSINCITLTIPHITSKYPHLASMVGKGSYTATGNKKGIMVQRSSVDSARIYLMLFSNLESYLSETGLDSMNADTLSEKLLSDPTLFADWGDNLKELINVGCASERAVDEAISVKPLYMLPTDHTWTHTPGLTLIGDAAHLMTPFAGEGVNVAMLDALELSQTIVAAYDHGIEVLNANVKEFEEMMWKRMKPISEDTYANLHLIFADDAPNGFVQILQSHVLEEQAT